MPPGSSYQLPPGIKYQDIKWYMIIFHTKSQLFYLCKTKVQLEFCLCTSSKIDLYSFISVIIWFLALAVCILSCLNTVLQLDTQLHAKELTNPPSITGLAYIIFVTCLGKYNCKSTVEHLHSHTHDETKMLKGEKYIFIYPLHRLSTKKSLIKVVSGACLWSRILWYDTERGETLGSPPFTQHRTKTFSFVIITERKREFFSPLLFPPWTRLQAIWTRRLSADLFLRNSNSKGAQGHPKASFRYKNTLILYADYYNIN